MRKEYYTAYSNETDMTFILEDVFENDTLVSTTVTGFYFGSPDEESTEKYKHTVQARFNERN